MHEMSLALSILDIASGEVEKNRATKVHEIHLEVGTQSGVDPEALTFALSLACKDTVMANARIYLDQPVSDSLRVVSLTVDEPGSD